ncbi:MAG: phosphatidate cytidylyltransferase [Ignavibacteriaceae bacterium]
MVLSNHVARVIVSIFAIPIILAAGYLGKLFFFFLILAIALTSFYEFASLTKAKGAKPNIWLGYFGILFLVSANYLKIAEILAFFILFLVVLSLAELFRNKGSAIINISATLLPTFYIGLFAGSVMGIREFYPNIGDLYLRGGYLIISIFASIWICDSAAYYGGSKFGKHKLFPRVSPNKSWEGAIFGFVFAVVTMILAKIIVLDFLEWTTVISFGIIIGTIGQLGDLIESLFKRDAEVKDSSALIPGHGGIFDRFDSLLLIAPVIFLYLKFFDR